MNRTMSLLAVAILTAASTGCNCCPCLRNICPFGACSNLCSPAPAPVTYAAVPACPPPAPVCAPAPVYAAAPAAMPVFAAPQQYTVPQYATPQYAMPAAQPVYSEAGCGSSYAAAAPCATCTTCSPCESSCGMAYSVGDPACGCTDVGYGTAPQQQMVVDPAPAQ